MPIMLIIYALAAASCFGGGYYTAWSHEHKAVLELQASIDYANKLDQQKLSEVIATIKEREATQRDTIKQLEIDHEKATEANDNLSTQLSSLQLHIRSDNQPRSSCPVPKIGNTAVGKSDAGAGQNVPAAGFSEELDRLISEKSALADKADEDKHYLLRWIDSMPSEMTK
jgi:hypothetical protein